MFMANHLVGFGAGSATLTETLFDRTLGTNIGDMTAQGGLAASFDGTTSAAQNTSGVSQTPGNVTSSYVGKNYSAVGAHGVSKVIAYGSTDGGFNNNLGTVTLTLYGKNGSNPSNATDGTSLGSVNFTDVSNQSAGKTITSGDTVTLYDRFWVTISSGTGAYKFAELQFYLMQ